MVDFWLKHGLGVSASSFLLAGLLLGLVQMWIISTLRAGHQTTWEELGNPPLMTIHPKQNWNVTMFAFRGAYEGLGDRKLSLLCQLARVLAVTHGAALLLMFTWPFVVLLSR